MKNRIVERLVLLGGLAVLIGVGIWIVASSDAPSNDAAPDTEADEIPDGAPDAVELDSGGPLDGLESLQLPIAVVPEAGLEDGQLVTVTGSGFSAGATIAMVQCWLTETGGSRDDCDLGNIEVAFADEQGAFEQTMRVHQLIDTANGVRDCALGADGSGCRIGVGNTLDLDESGAAEILFAPADAIAPPSIEASPTSGLSDGDAITVTGEGFEVDSTVVVTQCPVGGLDDASWGCVNRNPGEIIDVAADGSFSLTVAANRHPESEDGTHDCALEVYGCMLVVRTNAAVELTVEPGEVTVPTTEPAEESEDEIPVWVPVRSPNPIPLDFDPSVAPVLPPEYTVTPSQDLSNGSAVVLEVFDMPIDGSFAVRQCADGGPRGLFCDPRGVIEVVDGTGRAEVIVVETLINDDDSIDCTEPARRCYLALDGELSEFVRGPIRFAE